MDNQGRTPVLLIIAMVLLNLAALTALNWSKMKRANAFVKTRVSENHAIFLRPSGQSVQHLQDCYLVVAGHAQATLAIVPKIKEHLILIRLCGQLSHLASLYGLFDFFWFLFVEQGTRLSDSTF